MTPPHTPEAFRSSHRAFVLVLIAVLTLAGNARASVPSPPTDAELSALHGEVGRTLDRLYYGAGRRVDLARFDMEELARQGRPAPPSSLRRVDRTDRDLRARYLSLERRRAALSDRLRELPPQATHSLRIEDLEKDAGDAGWFGLRSARLEWGSGGSVSLPLTAFKGTMVTPGYGYLVEPSDAVFIYGRGSGRDAMLTGFEVPEGASGGARLVVSGLDDDKPGTTRIRITLDGTPLFEGENPFRATPWTEHAFPVPAAALSGTAPCAGAGLRLREDLAALRRDIDDFGAWADAQADKVDAATKAVRSSLVYRPLGLADDFWKDHFVRGVCYVPFEQELDHHLKSFRHLGANLLYSYAGHYNKPTEIPATLAKVKELGLPYTHFTHGTPNEERDRIYLGDPDAMLASARGFLRSVKGDSGVTVNLSVDEPNFRDEYATEPAVRRAFKAYIQKRRPALAGAGVNVPDDPEPVVRISSPADRPLWMEWQLFKTRHMAENMRRLWDGLQQDGAYPFIIIQDHRSTAPQQASQTTIGPALPLLSIDLYSNGSVREALVMDLLKNEMTGKAILTAGAGYSDKTPDRFRRSMAVGMAHADGVLQWTDIYFDKYRDPRAFWATASDDQGRDMLANWRPEYWAVMEDEYARMAQADAYLTGTASRANAAILFSERTAISDSEITADPYFTTVHGLYSDLLRRGRPLDARYTEGLTPSVLARYRALLLPEARVLTPSEENLLRAWVRAGGTLIATGGATLCDEWGRPRKDFGLADVFGAHYEREGTGASRFAVEGARVAYGVNAPYAKLSLGGAKALGAWENGDPALTVNAFGRGRAFYLTLRSPGARTSGPNAASGLFGEGFSGERELLGRLIDEAVGPEEIRADNVPDGLEVQVRAKGDASVVHLVDWVDGRTVKDQRLSIDRPGAWRAFYPAGKREERTFQGPQTITVRPFRIHEMLVIEPME